MKSEERVKREYRLLALAVVFFAAGAIFFWYDSSVRPSPGSPPPTNGSSEGSVVQSGTAGAEGSGALDPNFANFPPPSQFQTFIYSAAGINGSSTFIASTTCNAPYVAVLIFPSAIDYRSDINAAVYNHAFPCSASQIFMTSIATSDIAPAPFGIYYYFTADQGTSGAWYNPR